MNHFFKKIMYLLLFINLTTNVSYCFPSKTDVLTAHVRGCYQAGANHLQLFFHTNHSQIFACDRDRNTEQKIYFLTHTNIDDMITSNHCPESHFILK